MLEPQSSAQFLAISWLYVNQRLSASSKALLNFVDFSSDLSRYQIENNNNVQFSADK